MNEQHLDRSDRIASYIMKGLAIVGLAAIVALAAWLIVHGLRFLPTNSAGSGGAANAVTSLFKRAQSGNVSFDLVNYTFVHNEEGTLRWSYSGTDEPTYTFSYVCVDGVTLAVKDTSDWFSLTCETPYQTTNTSLTIRPNVTKTRFSELQLSLSANNTAPVLATVAVVNVALADSEEGNDTTTPTPASLNEGLSSTNATVPVTEPNSELVLVKPSDLSVSITETGVLVPIMNEDTFFPLEVIPADQSAAVRFTVSNLGTETSGEWGFTAALPTKSNPEYEYVSLTQEPLPSGQQVEFTLAFDELQSEGVGVVTITLQPESPSDAPENNKDSVSLVIE